ncbi:MAG: hypothetical protein PHP51_02575 [Desulfotomaculaceae bacterium]|nr:hypothetical protein [Desulfotomaculaceae bacterium]MDD4766165.1 hypothetical protein [Desulfotomaculaceae bacterium]
MVYLYIAVIIALAVIEGRPLIRNKKWAELAVFSFLIIAGAAVIIMDNLAFEPYRVSYIIDFIFRPYTSFIKNVLSSF